MLFGFKRSTSFNFRSARLESLIRKFLNCYVIVVTVLSLIWITATIIEGIQTTTTSDRVFSMLFGVFAPLIAFILSEKANAEFKRIVEEKKQKRWSIKLARYWWSVAAVVALVPAVGLWFQEPGASLLAKLFSGVFGLLFFGVYCQAGIFIVYKIATLL